jgi:hypothetical protein
MLIRPGGRAGKIVSVMNAKLDPIVSEFDTEDQAACYEHWFRNEVAASLADPRPDVPHDEAMARIRATIEDAKRKPRA